MNPELCEFLAENEWIKIKPNFNEQKLQLVCGDIGPFEAGVPVSVPLWMAILLKRKHSCEIILPEWLSLDSLAKMIIAENEAPSFTPIPPRFFEMAHAIFRYFKDDIVDGDQLKMCVLDLWDKRLAKMRSSTTKFLSQVEANHARMDNITPFEVANAKPSMSEALKIIDELHSTLQNVTPS